MCVVSSDEELGLSGEGAFEDAVVIIFVGDHVDLLCGVNKMGNGADGPDPRVGVLFTEAELLPQNTVELGQDKRRDEQVELPSADAGQDLIRLAPWKREGRDEHVGVQDDAHNNGGSYLRTAWTSRSTSSSVRIPSA